MGSQRRKKACPKRRNEGSLWDLLFRTPSVHTSAPVLWHAMAWFLVTPLPNLRRLTASVAGVIVIQGVTMQKSTDGGDSTAIVVFAFSTRDNFA